MATNPLTGVVSNNGAIKIVSAAPNGSPCDPTANVKPTPDLRAWATHIQSFSNNGFPITETEFSDEALAATELANLQAQCAFIGILGSGHTAFAVAAPATDSLVSRRPFCDAR